MLCNLFARLIGVEIQIAAYVLLGCGETPCICGVTAKTHAMTHPHACEMALCDGFIPVENLNDNSDE